MSDIALRTATGSSHPRHAYTLSFLVGTTRFERATSRPPAVRATNCATPRPRKTTYYQTAPNPDNFWHQKCPEKPIWRVTFPAYVQGGDSHATSTEVANIENPMSMMLGKSLTPRFLKGQLYYTPIEISTPNIPENIASMTLIELIINEPSAEPASNTIANISNIPIDSIIFITCLIPSGANA